MLGLLTAKAAALQVAPTYQIFTVKPGGRAEGRCTLTNNEEEDLTIKLSSKDWFVLPENKKFKAQDWLTFKEKSFPLKKGESKEVEFSVDVPKEVKGELVGMMSFGMETEIESNLKKVLSVAIYGAAQGTEKLKADVRTFMVNTTSTSLSVSALIVNKGNVHIRPTGFFEMKDEKGETVANVFMEQGRPTYPGKEGIYVGQVKDFPVKPGLYKGLLTFTDMDRKDELIKTTKKFEILENGTVEVR